MKKQLIVTAAMMGLIGAASAVSVLADAAAASGHCMGANSCKGKGSCKSDANSCKGTNGCKGEGWTAMSKAKCDKIAKKSTDKTHPVKWQAADSKS